MIVGTIFIAWRMLKTPTSRHILIALNSGIAAFAVFGLQSAASSDPALVVFFFAGMLAICAFILPGVSGSFLLLSIGMYQAVLGAVNDREMTIIAVFGLGAVLGLAVFSRVLERLLENHLDTVVAILIGFMLGSFRILWPWPHGLGNEDGVGATVLGAPSGDVVVPVVLAVFAAIAVIGFSAWAERNAD
jgi:putative membrane protein